MTCEAFRHTVRFVNWSDLSTAAQEDVVRHSLVCPACRALMQTHDRGLSPAPFDGTYPSPRVLADFTEKPGDRTGTVHEG